MGQIKLNQRVEPKNSNDYFPTPPWATRALCEYLAPVVPLGQFNAWEPACGEGHMVRPLLEYFKEVYATDLIDRRASWPEQDGVDDFVLDWPMDDEVSPADFIITNPPFNLAREFTTLALKRARVGVAFIVKQQILEGVTRHREVFNAMPPQLILQFAERVPMCKGRVDPDIATNQSYIWLVWLKDKALRQAAHCDGPHPSFRWIAPGSRKRFERPEDYSFIAADAPAPAALPLLDALESEQ